MSSGAVVHVEVVYSPAPRHVQSCALVLTLGATVGDALAASHSQWPKLTSGASLLALGIWGRPVAWHHVLQDQDRLEVYRPLRVDPKVARRERFKKQGAKSAGLFTKRRPGAKPGY